MSPKTHSTATLPWLMDLLKCCSRGVGEAPLKGLCKCTHNRYAGSLKTHTWLGYRSRSWVSCQHISMGNESVLTWYNSTHKDNRDSLTYRHRTTAKFFSSMTSISWESGLPSAVTEVSYHTIPTDLIINDCNEREGHMGASRVFTGRRVEQSIMMPKSKILWLVNLPNGGRKSNS